MKTKHYQKGIAMVAALGFMVITVALIGTLLVVNISNKRLTAYNKQSVQTQFAAEAAIDQAVVTFWHAASRSIEAAEGAGYKKSIEDYRDYWDNLTTPLESDVDVDDVPIFGPPITLTGSLDNGTTYQVAVSRKDIGAKSTLQMISTSNLGSETTRQLQQDFNVEFPPFELDFALLTDSINCTFCHSAFISMESAYDFDHGNSSADYLVNITNQSNRKDAAAGTERVRVAVLRQLLAEPGGWRANTLVGGTIYTRGSQNIIGDTSDCDGGSGCQSNVFGPRYQVSDGKVLPLIANEDYEEFKNFPDNPINNSEETFLCSSSQGDGNAGCEQAAARGYTDYPIAKEGKVAPIDGIVPATEFFPSPVLDLDGNRHIDDNEWKSAVEGVVLGQITSAEALLVSNTELNGEIKSGYTDTFTFTNVSAADIDGLESKSSLTPSATRGVPGNLILIGTDTNPIKLQGKIYVDGDVVIAGYIDPGNAGVIVARRNLYIMGDLIYDCNSTASGGGCEYYNPNSLPRLAMAAAGALIVADYSFVSSGIFANSATFAELMNFNQIQLENVDPVRFYAWQYRDTYVSDYDNLRVCTHSHGECRGNNGRPQRALTDAEIDSAAEGKAVIPLSPYGHWLTPENIRNDSSKTEEEKATAAQDMIRDLWGEFVENNAGGRPDHAAPSFSGRRALRIDGLLYSNNAIFAFLPTGLQTHGSLILNGSIIAYEVGVLIYGNANNTSACSYNQSVSLFNSNDSSCVGLQVQYDRRLPALLEIRDTTPELHSLSFEWQSVAP